MTHISSNTRNILHLLAGLLLCIVLANCANVMSPTGGPRDEDPPEILRSNPPNYSPNYDGEQIRVYFDEYITLHNLRQQLLVSPPLENDPDIRVRGRSIIIDIKDELRPNTTYNIFLGDAIRDITEGNAIPNFQYVFSTGDYVDSLSLGGMVIDAYTLDPAEGISVMLYDDIYDSIPYKERPVYFAKTNKEGLFTISNMAEGEYLIFVLADVNTNFLYDLPNEKIAFLDSLVRPGFVAEEKEEEEGEREGGREEGREGEREGLPFYTLYLFQEADTVQRVTGTNIVKKGQIEFSFRVPFDSVCVRDLGGVLGDDWHIAEFNAERNKLTMWFSEPGTDTLFIELFDGIHSLDTITTAVRPRVPRGRTAEEMDVPEPLTITPSARRGRTIPYFMPLTIEASAPVESIDPEKITLMTEDSLALDVSFRFSDHVRRTLVMEPKPEQGQSYILEIMPGAFTDIFGTSNDTLLTNYAATTLEDYSVVTLNLGFNTATGIENISDAYSLSGDQGRFNPAAGIENEERTAFSYILQLTDRTGNIIHEKTVPGAGRYRFENLTAGSYGFRLIEDRNGNGKWDTGNYLKGIQPERVFVYTDTLQVRANWEDELSWEIKINP